MIDTVFVHGIISKFALDNFHMFKVLDVFFYCGKYIGVSRTSIFQCHGENCTCSDIDINWCNSLIIYLRYVIYQVISFVDFIQWTVINEPDDFRDLIDDEFLILTNVPPHYQIFSYCFHHNVVLVTFLYRWEWVGDGNPVCELLIVAFQVH